ncbi:MAG TPA: hypothetical protein VKA34_09335 [Balneolales bacterium]|nr:hypothetical protein [Balneolales bacterium]
MENEVKEKTEPAMKPIWYFVGWMLSLIGGLIVIAGILNLFMQMPSTSVVGNIHPDLWWGGLITVTGIFYIWWNHSKQRV